MTSTKRTLSLDESIAAPSKSKKTSTTNQVAKAFDSGQTNVTNGCRSTEAYQADVIEHSDELTFLGIVVHEWIKRCQLSGVAVTDNLIRVIGLKVAQLTKYKEFRATSHWLARLKSEYKLKSDDLLNPAHNEADKGNLMEKSLVLKQIIADLKNKGYDMNKHGPTKWKQPPSPPPPPKPKSLKQYGKNQRESSQPSSKTAIKILDNVKLEKIRPPYDEKMDNPSSDAIPNNVQDFEETTDNIPQDLYAGIKDAYAKEIESYKQALNHLGPLEQFLLMQEDIRAVGLVNQLENMFRERITDAN